MKGTRPTYSFTFNSLYCTTATNANAPNLKSYRINWDSAMPEGKYLMTFTMITEFVDLTGGFNKLPGIYVNLLANNNQYYCLGQNTYKSEFIGNIYPTLIDPNAHINFLKADTMTNEPIFFNTRPNNNEITVSIFDNSNPKVLWVDSATPTPSVGADYVLTLYFTLLEENNNIN